MYTFPGGVRRHNKHTNLRALHLHWARVLLHVHRGRLPGRPGRQEGHPPRDPRRIRALRHRRPPGQESADCCGAVRGVPDVWGLHRNDECCCGGTVPY